MSSTMTHHSVLKRITLSDDAPRQRFTNVDATNGFQSDTDSLVVIPKLDWNDMGRPEVITVTVQPGDKLNEDG